MDTHNYVRVGSTFVHITSLLEGLRDWVETVPAGYLSWCMGEDLHGMGRAVAIRREEIEKRMEDPVAEIHAKDTV